MPRSGNGRRPPGGPGRRHAGRPDWDGGCNALRRTRPGRSARTASSAPAGERDAPPRRRRQRRRDQPRQGPAPTTGQGRRGKDATGSSPEFGYDHTTTRRARAESASETIGRPHQCPAQGDGHARSQSDPLRHRRQDDQRRQRKPCAEQQGGHFRLFLDWRVLHVVDPPDNDGGDVSAGAPRVDCGKLSQWRARK